MITSRAKSRMSECYFVPLVLSFAALHGMPSISGQSTQSVVIAPNIGWTTGTQNQNMFGGSALYSRVHSQSYCNPYLHQFGLAANASDTSTRKLGGTPVVLDSNDVVADFTVGIPSSKSTRATPIPTQNYLGVDAGFFENNSLGIGLQQTYTAEFQHYFMKCHDTEEALPPDAHRTFASAGLGLGYLNQRLYSTKTRLGGMILPLSAQISFLIGGEKEKPPRLFLYILGGYIAVLNHPHDYQLRSVAAVKIPTKIPQVSLSLSETELYFNNSPVGHKRNFETGTASIVFSFAMSQGKPPKQSMTGACYGGDKTVRLYCYDGVSKDTCSPPDMFRYGGHCSSSGSSTNAADPDKLDK